MMMLFVYNMDGRRFIGTIFSSQKTRTITQVVMNLPNDAVDFLGRTISIRILPYQGSMCMGFQKFKIHFHEVFKSDSPYSINDINEIREQYNGQNTSFQSSCNFCFIDK